MQIFTDVTKTPHILRIKLRSFIQSDSPFNGLSQFVVPIRDYHTKHIRPNVFICDPGHLDCPISLAECGKLLSRECQRDGVPLLVE